MSAAPAPAIGFTIKSDLEAVYARVADIPFVKGHATENDFVVLPDLVAHRLVSPLARIHQINRSRPMSLPVGKRRVTNRANSSSEAPRSRW